MTAWIYGYSDALFLPADGYRQGSKALSPRAYARNGHCEKRWT